jgi:alkaline phosphatase D
VTRIAIASCCRIQWQRRQPAWRAIANAKPDLVLLLGDNVYMREYKDKSRWDHVNLENSYRRQFREPGFKALLAETPFMATWDDHDFGPNDARGGSAPARMREASRALFHKYMSRSVGMSKPEIYAAHDVGDVRVIMLDTRFYSERANPGRPAATLLGKKQENWLWRQLDHDRRYTVIGTGTTLGPNEKDEKFETWRSYRDFYARFLEQIGKRRRVMVVSGDRHCNAFTDHGGFFEVTSSGVGRREVLQKKPRQILGKPLDNYGLIDFGERFVDVALHGRRDSDRIAARIDGEMWRRAADRQ